MAGCLERNQRDCVLGTFFINRPTLGEAKDSTVANRRGAVLAPLLRRRGVRNEPHRAGRVDGTKHLGVQTHEKEHVNDANMRRAAVTSGQARYSGHWFSCRSPNPRRDAEKATGSGNTSSTTKRARGIGTNSRTQAGKNFAAKWIGTVSIKNEDKVGRLFC